MTETDPVRAELAAAEHALEYLRGQRANHRRMLATIEQQIDANERHYVRLQGVLEGENPGYGPGNPDYDRDFERTM